MNRIRYVNQTGLIVETEGLTPRDTETCLYMLSQEGIKHIKVVPVEKVTRETVSLTE